VIRDIYDYAVRIELIFVCPNGSPMFLLLDQSSPNFPVERKNDCSRCLCVSVSLSVEVKIMAT